MSLFDKLFVDTDIVKSKATIPVTLTPEAKVLNIEIAEPDIKSSAEQILESALSQFNDRKITYLTLANLVSNLPHGSTRETILGILTATGIPIEEIFHDADDRLEVISTTQQKLQEKVRMDVEDFGNQVADLKARIAELESKSKQAANLLNDVNSIANIRKSDINKVMDNVREAIV